jgi:hypothetical protein
MIMTNSDPEKTTASGLATEGNKLLNDLFIEELTLEQIARVHNSHVSKGEALVTRHPKAEKRVRDGMTASRRAFMEALRRSSKYEEFGFGPGGELTKKNGDPFYLSPSLGVEQVDPDEKQVKRTKKIEAAQALVNWAEGSKAEEEALRAANLSPRIQQMLGVVSPKAPTPIPTVSEDLSDVTEVLFSGAQESQSLAAQYTARTFTACELADKLLVEHAAMKGEELWAAPVKVFDLKTLCTDIKESYLVVAVCSSTALIDPSQPPSRLNPKVKHDFRANDIPVTHSHPAMLEQSHNQRIIRSRSTGRGGQEYYVKLLRYVEGMVFRGYFVVDDIEKADLTTFWIAHKGKILPISETVYHRRLNVLAVSKN